MAIFVRFPPCLQCFASSSAAIHNVEVSRTIHKQSLEDDFRIFVEAFEMKQSRTAWVAKAETTLVPPRRTDYHVASRGKPSEVRVAHLRSNFALITNRAYHTQGRGGRE